MHTYNAALKKASGKLMAAAKKKGFRDYGTDWVTLILELIASLFNCNESSPKEAVKKNPDWANGLIRLGLIKHSKRRMNVETRWAMADMAIEEITSSDDDELEELLA